MRYFLHKNPALIPVTILVISVFTFWLVAGERFLSAFNLSLIAQQVTIIGILACAQTIIILTAGIDLSIAALMVLSSVVMGKLAVVLGLNPLVAIAMGIGVATILGAINGVLITRLRLPAFIVTLGTWNIFFAIDLWYSGAQSIRSQDIDRTAPILKFFGQGIDIGGAVLTHGVFLMLAIFIVLWYVLNRTAWGRHVYAVGDNKEAAQLAGIHTDRLILSVYAVAGFICGIAAWASIGRVGSVSPQSFYEANLDSITAVVIGGTSLFGGRGSIFGALFGALIVGVFSSGLKISGLDVLWQRFAIGCLIILAVALDQWIRKISA
uniref:Mannose ABC transporter membrane protein /fructose ABC transporter membrane protein /ribose ABC transporter membrane protein n=1 Tax=Candidatus Kentrum sp. MB TaxID=2138164 RepID=A0A450XBG9_9GAMM|nr:MAG: mannose ABC transporter membrane protein /fructose ABC transporter membrane protein /ribose ABC transporter membrane protein [Candidatus Kentron sp. MB]VFK26617.1 MAG: mannose ABC transporter membrane protein /fructose ABC transporter membrane protein /ribose ABC transporter membrane protein [Candidatus Kentron sp. MB]VFK74521.1 MAG: mannose ABC transporter membrane protein /fructose ABC transporter membrane protein /ribose ABC transporter membrane protein [Candidatus Kentron sp. MB]